MTLLGCLIYLEEYNLDHQQLEGMVCHKKENKLYSIFLKLPKITPTPKRKLSPQEQTVHNLRRMTITSDARHASPILRTPGRRLHKTGAKGSRSLSRSAKG